MDAIAGQSNLTGSSITHTVDIAKVHQLRCKKKMPKCPKGAVLFNHPNSSSDFLVPPTATGFVPGHGMVTFLPRNDPLAPAGTRRVRLKSALRPPLPSRPDAQWLYPLPLDMEVASFGE